MKKFLINTFALIGFLSFILLISSQNYGILLDGIISAEDNQIKNVADPTDGYDVANKAYVDARVSELINNNGKYQIEFWYGTYFFVLNTETGEMRTYHNNNGPWEEYYYTPPITFTH